jgi:hypothetical protein
MRAKLDIKPGSRIAVFMEGNRIVLRQVSERIVNQNMGVLKGKASSDYYG